MVIRSNFFNGFEVSDYGKKNGRVDFGTIGKVVRAILNNNIVNAVDDFEPICNYENDEDEYQEVFQWYIIDPSGVAVLDEIGEPIYYSNSLDLYLWAVGFYGTNWDYCLTPIVILND